MQVQKSTGKTPKDLENAPTLDIEFDYALKAYKEMTEHSWQELDAYLRHSGNDLVPWEIKAVMTLAQYKDEVPTWPLK
jgi:hypothetical protein